MPASGNFVLSKGKNAGGEITKKRFVKLDPSADDGETVVQCDTDGEGAFGVSKFDVTSDEADRGKGVSVDVEGRAVLEAAAPLDVGDRVATTADGRAKVADTGDVILGMVDEAAAATGNEAGVLLSIASGAISTGS